MYPQVPDALERLANEQSHLVVIFTNQAGVGNGLVSSFEFTEKLSVFAFDYAAFAAIRYDWNRKPGLGMWEMLQKELRSQGVCSIEKDGSFYVGDAAGRPRDHSDCDRKFAYNCQLKFYTPEEYFLGKPSKLPELIHPFFGDSDWLTPAQIASQISRAEQHACLFLIGGDCVDRRKFISDLLLLLPSMKVASSSKDLGGGHAIVDIIAPSPPFIDPYIQVAKESFLRCINLIFGYCMNTNALAHMRHYHAIKNSESLRKISTATVPFRLSPKIDETLLVKCEPEDSDLLSKFLF